MYDVFAMSILEASRAIRDRSHRPDATMPARGGEAHHRTTRRTGGLLGQRPHREK